ncbi:MAG: hypothetical protein Fur009_6410 [Candidatus Microgenomates bacterium]
MKTKNENNLKNVLGQFEEVLETYLVDKAPFSIPNNIKDLIVKFAPYLVIFGIIVTIPAVLAVFGLGVFLSPFSPMMGSRWGMYFGFNYTLAMIILGVSLVVEAMAVPGLFRKEEKAWRLMFYASLISFVSSFMYGGLFGSLIGALITWYILFQVKECYKS